MGPAFGATQSNPTHRPVIDRMLSTIATGIEALADDVKCPPSLPLLPRLPWHHATATA